MPAALASWYAKTVYLLFLATVLYAVGFLGNLGVPKSIDSGPAAPLPAALTANLLLLALFAVQHSGMARRWFKQRWTRVLPPPVERSTYVLASTLALLLIFWQWRPLPAVVWSARHPAAKVALWAAFGLGWGIMAASTCFIDHRDLFGLRQVEQYRQGRVYAAPRFQTPALYRYVRHPIYLGFTMAFWAAPVMTVGHALFAAAATAYILAGIQLEERDLVRAHGEAYEQYRQEVPMLLPVPRRR